MTAELCASLYGPMSLPSAATDDLIVRSLRDYGEWAFPEADLFSVLIESTDFVWDIGACVGTFGLGATIHNHARLLAVEANAAVYPCLQDNLARNAAGRSTAVMAAVGVEIGWATDIEKSPGNLGATRFAVSTHGQDAGVPMTTLRELRATHGDYDALKLDIEGMELDALRGDVDFLAHRKPLVWAECNENAASFYVWSGLKWLGYDPVYVAFPAFRKDNFKATGDCIYPMAYEAAIVGASPEILARLVAEADRRNLIVRPIETTFDLRQALWNTPRWSKDDWPAMSKAELIARLGRMSTGQTLETFFSDI